MRNGQIKFYKSGGAAQFRLLPIKMDPDGFVEKEGAILIEMAQGTGTGRDNLSWDWANKIAFAISSTDIMAMCDGEVVDLYHQSKGVPKKLTLTVADRSGYFLTLAQGKGATRSSVSMPLSEGEWRVLLKTFVSMVPYLVGWEA